MSVNLNSKNDGKPKNAEPNIPAFEANSQFLIDSGLLDGYEYCLRSLCKANLPEDNVFEFLAKKMEKFEVQFKQNEERVKKIEEYKKKLKEEEQWIKKLEEEKQQLKDTKS